MAAGILLFTATACGVKVEQLPQVNYPYISEIEFYKEVKNVDGKARKKRFKGDRIIPPVHFFLKINEMENEGTVFVRFYDEAKTLAAEREFYYGETGKYYEYIIFFDVVEELKPGKYRYTIFFNEKLIFEEQLEIHEATPKNSKKTI